MDVTVYTLYVCMYCKVSWCATLNWNWSVLAVPEGLVSRQRNDTRKPSRFYKASEKGKFLFQECLVHLNAKLEKKISSNVAIVWS